MTYESERFFLWTLCIVQWLYCLWWGLSCHLRHEHHIMQSWMLAVFYQGSGDTLRSLRGCSFEREVQVTKSNYKAVSRKCVWVRWANQSSWVAAEGLVFCFIVFISGRDFGLVPWVVLLLLEVTKTVGSVCMTLCWMVRVEKGKSVYVYVHMCLCVIY